MSTARKILQGEETVELAMRKVAQLASETLLAADVQRTELYRYLCDLLDYAGDRWELWHSSNSLRFKYDDGRTILLDVGEKKFDVGIQLFADSINYNVKFSMLRGFWAEVTIGRREYKARLVMWEAAHALVKRLRAKNLTALAQPINRDQQVGILPGGLEVSTYHLSFYSFKYGYQAEPVDFALRVDLEGRKYLRCPSDRMIGHRGQIIGMRNRVYKLQIELTALQEIDKETLMTVGLAGPGSTVAIKPRNVFLRGFCCNQKFTVYLSTFSDEEQGVYEWGCQEDYSDNLLLRPVIGFLGQNLERGLIRLYRFDVYDVTNEVLGAREYRSATQAGFTLQPSPPKEMTEEEKLAITPGFIDNRGNILISYEEGVRTVCRVGVCLIPTKYKKEAIKHGWEVIKSEKGALVVSRAHP